MREPISKVPFITITELRSTKVDRPGADKRNVAKDFNKVNNNTSNGKYEDEEDLTQLKLTSSNNVCDVTEDALSPLKLTSNENVNDVTDDVLSPLKLTSHNNVHDVADDDLSQLKLTATRLNLATRRPSYVAWKAVYIDKSEVNHRPDTIPETIPEVPEDEAVNMGRRCSMSESLTWIRQELTDMRKQDSDIAHQLLKIRKEIQRLRLEKSCEEHEEMLEDEMEEMEQFGGELSEICDMPLRDLRLNPLKHIGVTKLNLSARRFSTC